MTTYHCQLTFASADDATLAATLLQDISAFFAPDDADEIRAQDEVVNFCFESTSDRIANHLLLTYLDIASAQAQSDLSERITEFEPLAP